MSGEIQLLHDFQEFTYISGGLSDFSKKLFKVLTRDF
jgi:hypothetical protein